MGSKTRYVRSSRNKEAWTCHEMGPFSIDLVCHSV